MLLPFVKTLSDPLTCLSLLLLPYALHVWVDWNDRHLVRGVRVQVPQDGGGGATRHLLLFNKVPKPSLADYLITVTFTGYLNQDKTLKLVHKTVCLFCTMRSSPPGWGV